MSIRIQLFGNLRFTCDDVPVTTIGTNRLQSLLAFLMLRAGTPQSRKNSLAALAGVGRRPGAHESPATAASFAPGSACELLSADFRQPYPTVAARARSASWMHTNLSRPSSGRRKQRERAMRRPSARRSKRPRSLYQDELARGLIRRVAHAVREHSGSSLRTFSHASRSCLEEHGEFRRPRSDMPSGSSRRTRFARRTISSSSAFIYGNHDRASALRAYHQCMRVLRRELGSIRIRLHESCTSGL